MKHLILFILALLATPYLNAQIYASYADSANYHINLGEWKEAEQYLVKALKAEPGNPSNALLLSNLGVVRTELGRFNEALTCFEAGLGITPNSTVILTNRARTYMHIDRYDDAIADLTQALSIDSTLSKPRKLRGYIHLDRGDIKNAEKDFQILHKAFPDSVAYTEALAYCALEQDNIQEAERLFTLTIEKEESEDAYLMRAITRIRGDKLSEAADDIRLGMILNKRSGNLYFLRGWLNRLLYRNEESIADFRLAETYGAKPAAIARFMKKKP